MNTAQTSNCFNEIRILPEQFIPDHVFVYVVSGAVNCYDGDKNYQFSAGQYCLARKNRLARYDIENGADDFERIQFCFEEKFLRGFQKKHNPGLIPFQSQQTFVQLERSEVIADFIHSLKPYSDATGKMEEVFQELKFEELLLILLKVQPELAGLLFDYAKPEKINLEEFMNRNYKFNVSVARFAYLTGRSLSAFKRDFHMIFNQTPSRWLVQKRLKEAYFLISQKSKKPTEIYLELGFEDLSHFSSAFNKSFGFRPTTLLSGKKDSSK